MAIPRASDRVQLGVPHPNKAVPPKSLRDRSCAREGCETVLSIYNLSDTCWVHEEISWSRTRPSPSQRG
jgi:hypothetical protein